MQKIRPYKKYHKNYFKLFNDFSFSERKKKHKEHYFHRKAWLKLYHNTKNKVDFFYDQVYVLRRIYTKERRTGSISYHWERHKENTQLRTADAIMYKLHWFLKSLWQYAEGKVSSAKLPILTEKK